MIGHGESFDELSHLMDALFDGLITHKEASRLEQLVETSEDARQRFLDCVLVHGELFWEFTVGVDAIASEHGEDRQQDPLAKPAPPPRTTPPRRSSTPPRTTAPPRSSVPRWPTTSRWTITPRRREMRRRFRRVLDSPWRGAILVGAAMVLGGITLYLAGIGPHELGQLVNPDRGSSSTARSGAGSPESSETVQVATSQDAEWAEGGTPRADGRVPLGGTLSLNRGLAELEFPSGAKVILEGPAAFAVVSAQGARLSKGQLTARVPLEAVGFVIDTPDARIVDLGTEFAVAVEEHEWTEVEVVSGSVEVSPRAREAPSRTLLRRDAVRISSSVAGGQPQVEDISSGSRDYAWEIGPR